MLQKLKRIFYRSINAKEINYQTVQKMQKQKNGILIDVRSRQEYEEEHLAGAISISLYNIKQTIANIVPNKNSTIIVYCSSGIRSKQAQEMLEQMGYENVYNLKGGLSSL